MLIIEVRPGVMAARFLTLVIYFYFSWLGVLSCLDGYMNIALEQTEEYVNGKVTNRYGDCFVRGNNGESNAMCDSAFVIYDPFFVVLYITAAEVF